MEVSGDGEEKKLLPFLHVFQLFILSDSNSYRFSHRPHQTMLLKSPPRIRNTIYHMIAFKYSIKPSSRLYLRVKYSSSDNQPHPSWAIFQVCRQIRREVSPIFFQTIRFRLDSSSPAKFFAEFTVHSAHHVRYLVIAFGLLGTCTGAHPLALVRQRVRYDLFN